MKPKILICPLDWGLGHTTRSMAIIREFQRQNTEVLVALPSSLHPFVQSEFPGIQLIDFMGYQIRYSRKIPLFFWTPVLLLRIFLSVLRERKEIQKIIAKHNIDLLISDNRFGCRSNQIPSIYITHQLTIRLPLWMRFLEAPLRALHLHIAKKFDECWIPDFSEKPGLAGDLSHPPGLPPFFKYIGPISRIQKEHVAEFLDFPEFDLLVICSGPEPQRTAFEEKLTKALKQSNFRTLMLLGKPGTLKGGVEKIPKEIQKGTVFKKPHASAQEMAFFLKKAPMLIHRGGYSTLMEMAQFGGKALLIPTPGQTEQEYLAKNLDDHNICATCKQGDPNILQHLERAKSYKGYEQKLSQTDLLQTTIQQQIQFISNTRKSQL